MARKKKEAGPCQHEQGKLAWEEKPRGIYHFGRCKCGQRIYAVVPEDKSPATEFKWPE